MKINKHVILVYLIGFSLITCFLTNFDIYLPHYFIMLITPFIYIYAFNIRISKRVIILIYSILIWGILSILQQGNIADLGDIIMWICIILLGYCFAYLTSKKIDYSFIKKLYFIIILLSLVEGINQLTTGKIFLSNLLVPWADDLHQGTTSFFLQHIIFGNLLVVAFWLNEKLTLNNKIKMLFRVLILINLYGTRARSAWLCFVLIIGLSILSFMLKNKTHFKINKKILRRLGIIICFVLLVLIMLRNNSIIGDVISTIQNRMYRLIYAGEATYRQATASALIEYRLEHPNLFYIFFGSGINSTAQVLSSVGLSLSGNRYVVDNQIITFLFEFGVISVCFLLFLLYKAFKILFGLSSTEEKTIAGCYIINFFMALVYECVGFQVSRYLFFFFLGAMFYLSNKKGNNKSVLLDSN